MPSAEVSALLAAAVAELGGSERAGQQAMADAVADAMTDGGHLLVQAGTGTGKSLAHTQTHLAKHNVRACVRHLDK